ncbi:MAG: type II toxin-antitoxin system VapC family toxin [Patescibacteria group bacterium]
MNLILDNSIIVKWYLQFPKEEHVDVALTLKHLYDTGQINLHSPAILNYEIGNVFSTAVRLNKLDINVAKESLSLFSNHGIIFYDLKEIYLDILGVSIKYNLSFYDASYVTLSQFLKYDFITADKKLFNNTKNKITSVKYILDFKME